MKNGKKMAVTIRIKPVKEKAGCFLAYFSSGLLGSTYSVYFHYNIMGAIALHGFAEMIRMKYEVDTVIIETDEERFCQDEAVIDVMNMHSGMESVVSSLLTSNKPCRKNQYFPVLVFPRGNTPLAPGRYQGRFIV